MTKRFRWTEDALAEVVQRSKIGFTYAEIAHYLGTTALAVHRAAARHKLFPKELRSRLRSERLTGKKLSQAECAKRSRFMTRSWADPAIREERVRRRREVCQRPEFPAQIEAAARAAVRKRRAGFEPANEAEAAEYRFLTKTKRIPAAEAVAMIRASQSQARGGR